MKHNRKVMVAGLILLVVLLGALVAILFCPIVLKINSQTNFFQLRWGITELRIIPIETDALLQLRFAFWKLNFSFIQLFANTSAKKKVIPKERKAQKKRKGWVSFQRIWKVLQTFRISFFYLDLDFDDYAKNATWFPVFWAISKPSRMVRINFAGRNQCACEVRNRVFDVLIALIF